MRQQRILIVDDDIMVLEMMQIYIKYLTPECEIVTVTNGEKALTELQQQGFDLLLTDYNMPWMNGLDVIQAARQIAPDLPIVLMSGSYNRDELKTEASKIYLTEFFPKPFTMSRLKEILRENGIYR
jgi:YesN/AraC family two-component response regulator